MNGLAGMLKRTIFSETELQTYTSETVWPSGLRRWLKAPFRKGVGSNPTAVRQLKLHGYLNIFDGKN